MFFAMFTQEENNTTKKGRPPIGDKAMTNAEKQKRWRENRKMRAQPSHSAAGDAK